MKPLGEGAGSRVSVVIPALNEAESIGAVVRSMPWPLIAECIVVDNGSTDGTGEVAAAAGARVVKSPRGYGIAMYTGSQAALATSDILVYLDGDGSDTVADMPKLMEPIARGEADFVIASRMRGRRQTGSMLPTQVFASHLVTALVRALYRFRYTDMGPFRAIRREALKRMQMREMTFGWNIEMQIKAVRDGLRIVEIPSDHHCRIGGESKVAGNFKASLQAGYKILSVFWRVRRQR